MNVYKSVYEDECYGCGACVSECGSDAMDIIQDEAGFLRRKIDFEKCVECGKCLEVCPRLNPSYNNKIEPECLAAWTEDEIRMTCASGGIFTALAIEIVERGGYAVGAAWDENFGVEHILVDNKESLNKLSSSKYAQSNLKDIYIKVQDKLDLDKEVLFSGTPCQIAGLYDFLKKDYEKLYTIDLVCHGTPSVKILKKYLQDNYDIPSVKEVNFRDKTVFGWSSEMNVYLKNGKSIHKRSSEDSWYKAFLKNISLNPTCEKCQYSRLPRQGDITLGDFWNIDKYDKTLDDCKGTSLILINNEKGRRVIDSCKSIIRMQNVPLDFLKETVNKTVFLPFAQHPSADRFRRSFGKMNFNKLVSQCENYKYDIGLVTTWFARNFGAIFTAFALYKYLEKNGYSVLMLRKPKELWGNNYLSANRSSIAIDFGEKEYQLSKEYSLFFNPFIENINNNCECFILGSDQLWNPKVYANLKYFFLDFVNAKNRKFAYATSIGAKQFEGTDEDKRECKYLLKRFQAISNREEEAVNILENQFGVKSNRVIDPVFLLDKDEYNYLISRSMFSNNYQQNHRKYIFAYILDGNQKKKQYIERVGAELELDIICAYDIEHPEYAKAGFEFEEANINIPEDWLSYIKHAEFIITDSYHGACFSLIFEKTFLCFINEKRGDGRFRELFGRLDLAERLIDTNTTEEEMVKVVETNIDYVKVNNIIKDEVEYSKKWLSNAMNIKADEMSAEEYILERIRRREEASKKSSLQVFYSMCELGCSTGSSIQNIIDRLPENSYLQQVQGDFEPIVDTPLPFGVLTIKKTTNYFIEVTFSQMTYKNKMPRFFMGNVINSKLCGWTEFMGTDLIFESVKEINGRMQEIKEPNS